MSNQESMQQLTDRYLNDPNFRDEMRKDPEGAAEGSGLPLDEELKERVSKAMACWC